MKRKWLLLVLSLVLLGVSTTTDVPKSISADNSPYLITMVDNFTSWRQNSPRYVDVWVYSSGAMVEARELGLAQRETAIGTIVGFGPNDMVKLPYGVLAYYGDGRVIAGNCFIWRTGAYGWAGVGAVKTPSFSEIAGMRVCQFPADPAPSGYPYIGQPSQPPPPPFCSDRIDNDYDGRVDEEPADGWDNDYDGRVDEDTYCLPQSPPPAPPPPSSGVRTPTGKCYSSDESRCTLRFGTNYHVAGFKIRYDSGRTVYQCHTWTPELGWVTDGVIWPTDAEVANLPWCPR